MSQSRAEIGVGAGTHVLDYFLYYLVTNFKLSI